MRRVYVAGVVGAIGHIGPQVWGSGININVNLQESLSPRRPGSLTGEERTGTPAAAALMVNCG